LSLLQIGKFGVLKVASNANIANCHVQWNLHHILCPTLFGLEDNNKTVRFFRSGNYLVLANVSVVNPTNGHYMELQVSGTTVCRNYNAEASNYYKNYTIAQVIQVQAGQYLQIYSYSPSSTQDALAQKLSIIWIES
jgi:hypothetical protein